MGFAEYRARKAEETRNKPSAKPELKEPAAERPRSRGNRSQASARKQLAVCEREIAKAEEQLRELEGAMQNVCFSRRRHSVCT